MDVLRDMVRLLHHQNRLPIMLVVFLFIVSCVCVSRAIDLPRRSSWCPTKRGLVSEPQAAEEGEVSRSGAACTGLSLQCSHSDTLTFMDLGGHTVRVPAPSRRISRMQYTPALLSSLFSPFMFFFCILLAQPSQWLGMHMQFDQIMAFFLTDLTFTTPLSTPLTPQFMHPPNAAVFPSYLFLHP